MAKQKINQKDFNAFVRIVKKAPKEELRVLRDIVKSELSDIRRTEDIHRAWSRSKKKLKKVL